MAKKLKILVTNDDGVGAQGLDLLVKAARLLPWRRIEVLAPAHNMTGAGSSHHLAGKFDRIGRGLWWLHESATPVDCVRYGVAKYKPDLVLVGINNGWNIGQNVLCSGTCCAAAMAQILGVKQSIALSMHKPEWEAWKPEQIVSIIKAVIERNEYMKTFAVNLNLPSKPAKGGTHLEFEPSRHHRENMAMTISRSGCIGLGKADAFAKYFKGRALWANLDQTFFG